MEASPKEPTELLPSYLELVEGKANGALTDPEGIPIPETIGGAEAYRDVSEYFAQVPHYEVKNAYSVAGEWRPQEIWHRPSDSDTAVVMLPGLGADKESWYEQFIDEAFDDVDLVAYERPTIEARHFTRAGIWRVNTETLCAIIEELTRHGKKNIALDGHSFGAIVIDKTAEHIWNYPSHFDPDLKISILSTNGPSANMSRPKNIGEDCFLNAGRVTARSLERLASVFEYGGFKSMENGYDRLPKPLEWLADRVFNIAVIKPFLRESGYIERKLGNARQSKALLASLHRAQLISHKPRDMIRILKDAAALTEVPPSKFEYDYPTRAVIAVDDDIVIRNIDKYPKQLQRGRAIRQHPIISEIFHGGHCSQMVQPEKYRGVLKRSLEVFKPLKQRENIELIEGCSVRIDGATNVDERALRKAE